MTERHSWGRILLRLLVAVVVLGGAYVGLAVWVGGQVPSGTTVAGVSIGGMSTEQAATTLKSDLAMTASQPVIVRAGDETFELDPGAAGLSLDIDRTLQGLTGRTYDPGEIWQRLTGGEAQPLRVSVDQDRLEAALEGAAKKVDRPGREGSITFVDGSVRIVLSTQGRSLDVPGTAKAVAQAWPRQPEVKGAVTVSDPKLSVREIKRVEKSFAKPAMSGPVTVVIGKARTRLTAVQLGRMLTVKDDGKGHLRPDLDGQQLLKVVRAEVSGAERVPVDAQVRLIGGEPRVIPGHNGKVINPKSLHDKVFAALTAKSRTARVATISKPPATTTAEANKLGVKQVISSFTSHMPGGPENAARTHNIKTALDHINGTLVKPGEQFSLLGVLGTFTRAKGYVEAHVISNGRLVNALGGGISQVSTTVFNTSYFAGVQLDEHTPHSFYISRYPVGREATLWRPTIDNKWTNNTGHGILIQTWVTGQDIHMRFWGTKTFAVSSHTGERRNITAPKTIYDDSPKCIPQYPVEGFDITVTRTVRRNGTTVDHNVFNTHYKPEDRVVCTG
jgi:vancomycin resistance protein YoaR